MNSTTEKDVEAQLKEAKARLADLAFGARCMLEIPMPAAITGSFKRFAEEVKRVASAPL
jgi:hypothetical protein